MGDRSRRILTMALNLELAQKKSRMKMKRTNKKETNDPDYVPISKCSSSSSGNDSDEGVDERILQTQNMSPFKTEEISARNLSGSDGTKRKRINIISDILITAPPTEKEKVNEASSLLIVRGILDDILENVYNKFTKMGQKRKRQKFVQSVKDRKKIKLEKIRAKHSLRNRTCELKKCKENCLKISDTRRAEINTQFWKMTPKERKTFLLTYTKKNQVKRRTVQPSLDQPYRRQNSLSYYLKDEDGNIIDVCKENFTSTLGYCTNNDRVIRTVLKAEKNALIPLDDRRGSHTPANKLDKSVVIDHINSFTPSISHYRREHAPLRLYLPTDLNANIMYRHFQNIYGDTWCSYDYYRSILRDLNISFVKLGHEECFVCEKSNLHFKSTDHKKEFLNETCINCNEYERHILKAQKAREQYKADACAALSEGKPVFSGDLQKVIMLPRFESLKDVIFSHRLVAFNETFAPVGTKPKRNPLAILWHEAITGRSRIDIISTFYRFFIHNRDETDIVLWLDNCSSQNKNWALFSMFAYIVNCQEVCLDKLQVKYFEPGHTFMSADSFHHQVEKSLKAKHKVLDFNDFIECVKKSNSGKVDVVEMTLNDFLNWKDLASQYKISRATPRPYLKNIVYIEFNRGSLKMKYKHNFADEPLIELSFLTKKAEREKLSLPESKADFRGFPALRKKSILDNLTPIIPSSRLIFWQQLPEVEECREEIEED